MLSWPQGFVVFWVKHDMFWVKHDELRSFGGLFPSCPRVPQSWLPPRMASALLWGRSLAVAAGGGYSSSPALDFSLPWMPDFLPTLDA